MSYTNGIGVSQQAINSITPSEAKPTVPSREPLTNVQHSDEANLSSTGGLVAQALEGSDTRSAKVASLQQAIATGSYSVSSSDVADKIIQSLLE